MKAILVERRVPDKVQIEMDMQEFAVLQENLENLPLDISKRLLLRMKPGSSEHFVNPEFQSGLYQLWLTVRAFKP